MDIEQINFDQFNKSYLNAKERFYHLTGRKRHIHGNEGTCNIFTDESVINWLKTDNDNVLISNGKCTLAGDNEIHWDNKLESWELNKNIKC